MAHAAMECYASANKDEDGVCKDFHNILLRGIPEVNRYATLCVRRGNEQTFLQLLTLTKRNTKVTAFNGREQTERETREKHFSKYFLIQS